VQRGRLLGDLEDLRRRTEDLCNFSRSASVLVVTGSTAARQTERKPSMNTVHDAAAVTSRTSRTGSQLRIALTVVLGVLAALLVAAVLFTLLFGPASTDAAPVEVSGEEVAALVAFECPDGADACVLPVPSRPRPPRA
jgi:hypothetical protein